MPVDPNYDVIDLRVIRKALGLSTSTASKFIGGCSLTTWLEYELNASKPPQDVVNRIHQLSDFRVKLKELYLKKIHQLKPESIPFFSNFLVFKHYYPSASELTYTVFTTLCQEVYAFDVPVKLVEISSSDDVFDKRLLIPECVNCEVFTVDCDDCDQLNPMLFN